MLIKNIQTSESVGYGHPDKICDQIADLILDTCLKQDKNSRVACEVFAGNKKIIVGGEITTKGYVDVVKVAWKVLKFLGYNENDFTITSCINKQSPDIAAKVNLNNKLGAGDQGLVYGYACNETKQFLPLATVLSHEILKKTCNLIKVKKLTGIKYDMKSQVSIDYSGKKPIVDSVILSVQHNKNINLNKLRAKLDKIVINPILNDFSLNTNCQKYINYGGTFVLGGPEADTGLTGRKIIVDTYGSSVPHGGGAFSGKDATKVDRTGAYFARYIAKNIVAADLAKKVLVQLSFCIGKPTPTSISINTFNTCNVSEDKIKDAVVKSFNFDLANIIKTLNLTKPIFSQTSVFGHFGKNNLPWEKTNKVKVLRDNIYGRKRK